MAPPIAALKPPRATAGSACAMMAIPRAAAVHHVTVL
jgi:hypothetical protein